MGYVSIQREPSPFPPGCPPGSVPASCSWPFDGSRFCEACRGIGRGSKAGRRLTEAWQPHGAWQAWSACFSRGPWGSSSSIFAVDCLAGPARESWDPRGPGHPRMPTSHLSPVTLLAAFSLGPCIANLTHGSHDARNTPRARMPVGSLLAWVPRRPRGSWGTHHPDRTQGLPLGTHSDLCQLLLHHLHHHRHDVLVTGISARHALSPRQSRHASVSS